MEITKIENWKIGQKANNDEALLKMNALFPKCPISRFSMNHENVWQFTRKKLSVLTLAGKIKRYEKD